MKWFASIFLLVFMAGCAPFTVQKVMSVSRPGIPVPQEAVLAPTQTANVKVVSLATQTPLVPATPTPEQVFQAPKTLAELGYNPVTYVDTVGGYAFDYPADWILTDMSDAEKQSSAVYTVTIHSTGNFTPLPKNQDSLTPGMSAINFTVSLQGGPTTLAQAIEARRAQAIDQATGKPFDIQVEETWELAGGLKAHRFLYNLGPDAAAGGRDKFVSELVLIVNGRQVLVTGMGDQSLFVLIAYTIRANP